MVENAHSFLIELPGITYQMSEQDFISTWQKIEVDLSPQKKTVSIRRLSNKPMLLKPYWYYVAASLPGLALAATFWFCFAKDTVQTYQTAYGETQQYRLPDSSVVTLNSNSTLR